MKAIAKLVKINNFSAEAKLDDEDGNRASVSQRPKQWLLKIHRRKERECLSIVPGWICRPRASCQPGIEWLSHYSWSWAGSKWRAGKQLEDVRWLS
jgi:hypothetical protein